MGMCDECTNAIEGRRGACCHDFEFFSNKQTATTKTERVATKVAAYVHLVMSIGAGVSAVLFVLAPGASLGAKVIGALSGCGVCWAFGLEYKELKAAAEKEKTNAN